MITRLVLVVALAVGGLFGQSPLERLVAEAQRLRQDDGDLYGKAAHKRIEPLAATLTDWIDSRLPRNLSDLNARFMGLQSTLSAELWRAGLFASLNKENRFGYVGRVDISSPPEMPGVLLIIAGVEVPCGVDDTVLLYKFDESSRVRLLMDIGESATSVNTQISDADEAGNRLLLTWRYGVQCASSWNRIWYRVYRLPGGNQVIEGNHGIWFNDDEHFVLKPDELLLEFRDASIDTDVHNRKIVLRYKIAGEAAERIDPVALQPQDFVAEWLQRPWSEMGKRSLASAHRELEQWHRRLHADFVLGEYEAVQSCEEKPGHWRVSIDITHIGEKKLAEPLPLQFQVKQTGEHSFVMVDVSETLLKL